MDNQTVKDLVERVKNGDAEAFGTLYEKYQKEMLRYALYITGNISDAEDAVQEAVFSAWENIKSLKASNLFKPWLFRILQNKCRKILRDASKGPDTLPLEECEFLLTSTDEDFSPLGDEIVKAIASLTPPDGQLIMLSVIGGFTSAELAMIFSLTPSNVRSRQSRALKKLRDILEKE